MWVLVAGVPEKDRTREREISNWIGKSSSNQEGGRLGTATGNPLFCVITV